MQRKNFNPGTPIGEASFSFEFQLLMKWPERQRNVLYESSGEGVISQLIFLLSNGAIPTPTLTSLTFRSPFLTLLGYFRFNFWIFDLHVQLMERDALLVTCFLAHESINKLYTLKFSGCRLSTIFSRNVQLSREVRFLWKFFWILSDFLLFWKSFIQLTFSLVSFLLLLFIHC